jgi:phage shock protein C
MKKTARGNTRTNANNLASLIKFNVEQKDSILLLEKGIAINKTDKFRNQMVIITVYVPVGKQVRVKNGIGWPVHFGSDRWNDNWDNDYYDGEQNIRWQPDVDYIMKEDGLYTLTGRKADGSNDRNNRKQNSNNNRRTYRYNAIEDSLQRREDSLENRRQQKVDSIERRYQQQKDSMDNLLEKEKNKIENANGTIQKPEQETLSSIVMPGVNILPDIN